MGKIQCKFCKFESNTRCVVKKTSVKINKHRICEAYKVDVARVEDAAADGIRTPKIPKTFRPDWFWDKKKRRAARDAALHKELEMRQPIRSTDNKHPLTGDLSRFVSSVEDSGTNENNSNK